jgi:hypothetical protein
MRWMNFANRSQNLLSKKIMIIAKSMKTENQNRSQDPLQTRELVGVDLRRLVELILDAPWHAECEIIPAYMPPFPEEDTRAKVVIRHNNGTEHPAYLRYSRGPKQGFFWDIYGDDMQDVELAIVALSQAPYPRSVAPMVFKLPIRQPNA